MSALAQLLHVRTDQGCGSLKRLIFVEAEALKANSEAFDFLRSRKRFQKTWDLDVKVEPGSG